MRITKAHLACVFSLLFVLTFSQSDSDYKANTIPLNLKVKANAVVRYDKQIIEINDFDDMYVTTHRIVTVFNEYGDRHQNAFEGYDDNTKIKVLEARIYDASGDEIKKYKERDFNDQSAVSGGTLYSDSRVKYLSYTPVKYPYTIEYTSEVAFQNTSYIQPWTPLGDFYVSVQMATLIIRNNTTSKISIKKENFNENKIDMSVDFTFLAKNIEAVKPEAYSSGLFSVAPRLSFSLGEFIIDGVKGTNSGWDSQGKWMYKNLIAINSNLPEETKEEIRSLVVGIEDPIKKAKIVYKYVQDNTRYISVQEGIGGMQPIASEKVDEVKYGDCKGLSNYTKDLLDAVGVESYYTRLYASQTPKDVDKNFVSFQGQTNHVILALPSGDDYIWLECTNQTNPFGFIAGFTDDRDVLVIKPEGGEIVHTKVYDAEDSKQITKATVNIANDGAIDAKVTIETTGYQYALHENVVNKSIRDQKLSFKEYWDNINNLDIESIEISNNKDDVVLTENVDLKATNYASKSGSRLIFMPNMFNRVTLIPARYDKRYLDFKIQRAYKDTDEYIINLPDGVVVEAMSEGEKIESKFGIYEYKIEKISDHQLKYSRLWIMNKGDYNKEDYDAFRDFRKQIVKLDKTKIVLKVN